MWSEFEKNQFIPTEFARGKIFVNNENCQIAAERVSFYIEQRLRIKADIEQGVDQAVEVHHHHEHRQVGLFHLEVNWRHKEDVVGSDAKQECSSDGSHHKADLLLSQESSFLNTAEN